MFFQQLVTVIAAYRFETRLPVDVMWYHVTWLIHMCTTTHICMWHVSIYIKTRLPVDMMWYYVTWLIYMCAICVTCLSLNRNTTICFKRRDAVCIPLSPTQILMYMWHASQCFAARLPVACTWHSSSICVPRRIQRCVRSYSASKHNFLSKLLCFPNNESFHSYELVMSHIWIQSDTVPARTTPCGRGARGGQSVEFQRRFQCHW